MWRFLSFFSFWSRYGDSFFFNLKNPFVGFASYFSFVARCKIRPPKEKKKKKNIDYVLMINELHKIHTCHSWEGDEIYKAFVKIIC
jgi:hypothetical protein